jgi:hypothetical protein
MDYQPDTIVQSVIQKFIERSKMGKEKYGTDLDRTDLKTKDWIQHAQEELMDGILYLEKLKQTINETKEKEGEGLREP